MTLDRRRTTALFFALQNEPDLDLTVEESQQRVANVMQLAKASINGVVQVRSARFSCDIIQQLCPTVKIRDVLAVLVHLI